MESIRDYLGWEYAFIVGWALFFLWIMFISFTQRRKSKQQKNAIFKKWWFWVGTIVFTGHAFLIQIGAPWLGFGTPDHFSQIHLTENEIILFDEEVTYNDDDTHGTNDYTTHLRIHVVDRKTHQKKFSDLIGSNYSTFVDSNGVFIYYFTSRSYSDYTVQKISQYNLETKELEKLIEVDDEIKVDGKTEKVFEIRTQLAIIFKSVKGDEFICNTKTKTFSAFHGDYPSLPLSKAAQTTFNFQPEYGGSDKQILHIGGIPAELTFIAPEIADTYHHKDSGDFALILSYTDLNKKTSSYAMVNASGDAMWELDEKVMKNITGHSGLNTFQRSIFEGDLLYLTADAYLFEVALFTGKINWWLKL